MHRLRATSVASPAGPIGARSALAALVALVALTAACTLPPPYEGPETGPEVVIIGDSLVLNANDPIKLALWGAGWRVSQHGEPGLSTRGSQPRLVGAAFVEPGAVVTVTLANDAFDLHRGLLTATDEARALDEAFGALQGVPCVVWVLLNEHATFYGFPQWAPVVNSMVVARASGRPNVRLLDWRHQVVAHPEWFQADQFHHTPAGDLAFAAAIRDTLATCPR